MPEPQTLLSLPGEHLGLIEPGNLDLLKRPDVPNPAGGTSSVFSMSIGMDGREYLIPRVSEDARLLGEEEAIAIFEKTGNHLGVFDSPESATAYAEALHEQQAELGRQRQPAPKLPQAPRGQDTVDPALLDMLMGG